MLARTIDKKRALCFIKKALSLGNKSLILFVKKPFSMQLSSDTLSKHKDLTWSLVLGLAIRTRLQEGVSIMSAAVPWIGALIADLSDNVMRMAFFTRS